MNRPRPRVPAAAPSGRARIMAISPSACEQNHFSPETRQWPNLPVPSSASGSKRAVDSSAPTSEPPGFSVMNWAPNQTSSMSWVSSRPA